MAKPPTPAAALAASLIEQLRALRAQGDYPVRLSRLLELTAAEGASGLQQQALQSRPFKRSVLIAQPRHADSLVALVEDSAALAASPLLLEAVLQTLCTTAHPTWPIRKLTTQVAPKLKQPFAAAIRQHLSENTLPASVGWVEEKQVPLLHLQSMPPPPPPPEERLAEQFVRVLQQQAFVSWGQLTASADEALAAKAAATKRFRERAIVALKKRLATSPVLLKEDATAQLGGEPFLRLVLTSVQTPRDQALPLTKLKAALVTALQKPFANAVQQQIDSDTLPASIALIRVAGKALLFLREIIRGASQPAVAPATPAAQPVLDFDDVFARLDGQSGSNNLVSLVALRRTAGVPREVFDAELRRLRQAGRYSLSAAEGRHGIAREEQEAGIVEGGTLLLYVSRLE